MSIKLSHPSVSVVMITYMHEKYLAEAINGVLSQKCNFQVELIIADDCSPDRTDEVVNSFRNHHNFHWVKYTKHQKNKGVMANFFWALREARGVYIALCEGDDFWTDDSKLQTQVDFLDKNIEFSGSVHYTSVLLNNEIVRSSYKNIDYRERWTVEDLRDIDGTLLSQTSSFVFKRETLKFDMYKGLDSKIFHGDTLVFTNLFRYGPIHFVNRNMSVYRLHENGISKLLNNQKEKFYRDRVLENVIFKRLFPFLEYKFEDSKRFYFILYALTLELEGKNRIRSRLLLKIYFSKWKTWKDIITRTYFRRPFLRLVLSIVFNKLNLR